jgi:hypothetical protein
VSPLTIYLAKVLGLYCVIVAVTLSANKQGAITTVNRWVRSPPLMMLTSVITLAIGLALVIGHNVWSGGALPITVTVIGWLTLFKGLAFLLLSPTRAQRLFDGLEYEKLFFVYVGVTFALGLYLSVSAFSS